MRVLVRCADVLVRCSMHFGAHVQELARHEIQLVADVPGVGANLMDHGVCPVQFRLNQPNKIMLGNPGIPGIAFFQSEIDLGRNAKTGAVRGPDIQLVLTLGMSADGAPKQSVQDIEQAVATVKSDPALQELYKAAVLKGREERSAGLHGSGVTDAASIDTVLNRPQSRGVVSLRDSCPHTLPIVDGRWLQHPDDVESQLCGLRKIRSIICQQPMAGLVAEITASTEFVLTRCVLQFRRFDLLHKT